VTPSHGAAGLARHQQHHGHVQARQIGAEKGQLGGEAGVWDDLKDPCGAPCTRRGVGQYDPEQRLDEGKGNGGESAR
jgi:hypothetical protein